MLHRLTDGIIKNNRSKTFIRSVIIRLKKNNTSFKINTYRLLFSATVYIKHLKTFNTQKRLEIDVCLTFAKLTEVWTHSLCFYYPQFYEGN